MWEKKEGGWLERSAEAEQQRGILTAIWG